MDDEGETMSKKIIHEDVRRELDNYINHLKANGLKIKDFGGEAHAYAVLLHEVMQIDYANLQIEENDYVNKITKMKKLLEKVLHELNSLNGLYASDNKEMLQPFKLDYIKLIKEVEGVIEDDV